MKTLLLVLLTFTIQNLFAAKLSLSFKAKTSIPGMDINGKLKEPILFDLKKMSFIIPVESLDTGLELRDKEMRNLIFNNKDISISYNLPKNCSITSCLSEFKIKINDKSHSYQLKIEDSKSRLNLKLSDFNIKRPERLGVSVKDLVEVKFDVQP